MRCLETTSDILTTNSSKVEVHILTNIDQYQYALCFKTKDFKRIYMYTTRDSRGPISTLIPINVNGGRILWNDEGVISLMDDIDPYEWTSSIYLFTITKEIFRDYQMWLLRWIKKHTKYSIIETNNTIRTFLTHSLKQLTPKKLIKSVMLPEIQTYYLKFRRKERCAATDAEGLVRWYEDLVTKGEDTLKVLISDFNKGGSIYYHEVVSGSDKYWILEEPCFVSHYSKLEYTPKSLLGDGVSDRPSAASDRPSAASDRPSAASDRPSTVSDRPNAASDRPNADSNQVVTSHSPSVAINACDAPNGLVSLTTPLAPVSNDNGILLIIFLVAILIIMIIVIVLFIASRNTTTTTVSEAIPVVKSTYT